MKIRSRTERAWRGVGGRTGLALLLGLTLLLTIMVSLSVGASSSEAGTVSFFQTIVNQTGTPDTRGGMVLDDRYVWISDHKTGLWRYTRCTINPPTVNADVAGNDGASWDLWWYNSTGNYPSNPDAGYYIYEAGSNGQIYVFNTSAPTSRVGATSSRGDVAYGVYATDPTYHTLYAATTGGLHVYNITNPASPTFTTTLMPGLDFGSVRGIIGQPYVYANSYTNNTTYVIDVRTNAVVASIAYGGSNSIRRAWVYESVDHPGTYYLYVVNHSGDLWISDVTDPTNPKIVTYWNSPAGGIANMPGGGVYVQNDYAFVLTSTGNDKGYLYMLDVRDPTAPVLVDTLYDAAFGYNDIRMDGCEIHIAAHDGWKMYRMQGWQPDARISNSDTSNYVANNIYEATPTTQIKSQYIEPGQTATFQMYFENDADRRDRIALSATTVPLGWTAQYLVGGVDVTASVLAGTYLTGYLHPGEGFRMTLVATPTSPPTSPSFTADVTAKSWMCMESSCGGPKDVVRAAVTLGTPSMTVTKTDGKTYVSAGDSLSYTVTYSNVGYGTAYDVVLTDVVPAGLKYDSAIPAPSSMQLNQPAAGQTTLTWNVGTLPPRGGPYTITVKATVGLDVADGASLTNTATMGYKDVAGNMYPTETASDTDTVTPRVVRKSVDKTEADFNHVLTYTVTPHYPGHDLLGNVHVIDQIPVGTTYVPGSITPGSPSGFAGPYTSQIPARPGYDAGPPQLDTAIAANTNFVNPGDSVTVTLNVKSSQAIPNVLPSDLQVDGGAYQITAGPNPASANVPAGATGVNFTWTVKLIDQGEYVFGADAEDVNGDYGWPVALSASVLAWPGANNFVIWSLGSNVGGVAGITITSGRLPGVFGTRGANTKEFSRYGILTDTWASKAQPTNGIEKGGSLTTDGAGTIYASEGNSKVFYKYTIDASGTGAGAWTRLGDASANFNEGGGIQYLVVGGVKYVYAVLGNSTLFSRYNISTDTWTALTATPWTVKKGGAITTDGTYLYVLQGDRKPGFARYNITAGTWTSMAPVPGNVGWGGSLTRVGGYIYAMQGDGKRDFYRYDIGTNTWTAMALTPGNVGDGGALTTDGTTIYAFQGKTKTFWRYTIASNTWTAMTAANFTGNVGQGGALVYDPGVRPEGRFTSMYAESTLVHTGDTVTVTMMVESSAAINNVVPTTPTITATGGASATLTGGPTPASVNLSADVPAYFTWTYKVTAGTGPGSLTFSASATGDGGVAFPSTTSNSVLVAPPLTFKVTVAEGAPSPVTNTATYFEMNYSREGVSSNEVQTKVGASIGDYIWYDSDADGLQDITESGIAGVTVTLKNASGTVVGTATTDATGYYLFSGLNAQVYTVTVTMPAGMMQTFDPDGTKDNTYTRGLSTGESYLGADFGYDDGGKIGDLVWNDANGNGMQDVGEMGIANITVSLYKDANANGIIDTGDTLLTTTSTDASGAYSFIGLPAGSYLVAADGTDPQMPMDYEPTTSAAVAVTLTAGQNYTTADFGFAAFGSIGDRIWYDENGDGMQDPTEPGLSGVQVVLTGPTGTFYATTAPDGYYSFQHLPAGTYTVTVNTNSLPPGYAQTFDPDGVKNNSTAVTLAAGQDYDLADFGYDGSGKIGDRVWYDTDGDKVQDTGEGGISGLTVKLYEDINGNGQIDPGEPLVATTTTGTNGAYVFTGLPAGNYLVMADGSGLTGYTNTTLNPFPVALTAGQNYTTADIGFGPFAQLGDFVWNDLNADGFQDLGEMGIAGVTVTLTLPGGGTSTAVTDANGYYLFDKLVPGAYTATVTSPLGLTATTAISYTATLTAGQFYDTADFGFRGGSSIGDRVWYDTDGDGVQDTGETGIAGVTVYLYQDANHNGYFDDGEPFVGTATTDANGNYIFGNLPPGDYLAVIDRSSYPGGTGPTTPTSLPITLPANTAYATADFGFGPFSAIGDTVYIDANANGVQDTGTNTEPGVAGVTVWLYEDTNGNGVVDAGEPLLGTQVTDAYGHYFFGGLTANGLKDYVVMVDTTTIPSGTTLTTPNPYSVLDLAANSYYSRADFGLRGTSSIGDLVWNDANANGIQDLGELGIAGITVQLYQDTNGNGVLDIGAGGDMLVATTETNGSGNYSFTNVNVGSYFVYADPTDPQMPAGYTATTANAVPVSITSAGQIVTTADVGFGTFGAIGDFVWNDLNGNGIQDTGEVGIPGVTVNLYNSSNVLIATTTTNASGNYLFNNLVAGTYSVDVVESTLPSGYIPSPANVPPDDTKDSDSVSGAAVSVTVTSGANVTIDFGFFKPAPTVALVGGLDAVFERGNVVVTWTTLNEAMTAGYYLERLDSKTGEWVTLNDELVPALVESPVGGSYAVIDTGAQPNKELTYRLREMETEGGSNYYGPYVATAKPGATSDALSQQLKSGKTARVATSVTLTAAAPSGSNARVKNPPAPTFAPLCIEITKAGLYRLDAADLATALGLDVTAVTDMIIGNKLALSTQGKPVGLVAATDGSALFFYGQAIDSIYTSTNVYWLTSGTGIKMAAVKDRPASGKPATTFIDTLRIEKNLISQTAAFHDPEADFWVWDYVSAGSATIGTKSFAFDAPAVVRGITLDVVLQGMTSSGVANEHHAQIKLNGTVVGDVRWTGIASKTLNLTLPAGLLLTGANEIQVTGLRDTGVAYSMFALNYATVTYERSATAVSDQLVLRRAAAGPVTVGGLSITTPWVLDLADPLVPKLAKITASGTDPAGSWITFSTGAQGQDYLVATAAGAMKPQAMTVSPANTLKAAGIGAEYVVITTPGLRDAAQRLADYRAGTGLSTKVVTTYEIYDEFSFGLVTPHAFSDFIAYALASWSPTPRFVVFVGEGSYDYKNNLNKGDSLVPPLMVDTPTNGLAPSDVRIADVVGDDGVADVAIGRVPGVTAAQIDAYLAKVQAYEAAEGTWRQNALMVADNPDYAGNFPVDSDSLAALLPSSFTIQKAYLGALTTSAARTAILSALNGGVGYLNYVGHGTVLQLAGEGLLTPNDVGTLSNSPRLPVVSLLTCLTGQYGMPGIDGLGETLVKRVGGGAIAVFAPTAMESNAESVLLGNRLLQRLYASPAMLLGEAVRAAAAGGAQAGVSKTTLETYTLLGDPALRVR